MVEYRHGGEKIGTEIRYDFSVNTNPYGMPEKVREAIARSGEEAETYPDIHYRQLKTAILEYERQYYPQAEGITEENILVGNGASELIMALAHAYRGGTVLLQTPLFYGYERAFSAAGCRIFRMKCAEDFSITEEAIGQITELKPDAVILCQPGNPTGAMIDIELLKRIADTCRETGSLLCADECFIGFVADARERSVVSLMEAGMDMLILRAFTKLHAMAGVRLGYGICGSVNTAERIGAQLPEWNVSGVAEAAGRAALTEADYVRETTERIRQEREHLSREFGKMGLSVIDGEANFILFYSKTALYEKLLQRGILVRSCDNYYGIDRAGYYRVAVRQTEENAVLVEAIREILERENTG